jgi:CheY-like chemotaxis protein
VKGKKLKIETALNGEEAIAIVMNNINRFTGCCSFNLVFLDIHMPIMDGF